MKNSTLKIRQHIFSARIYKPLKMWVKPFPNFFNKFDNLMNIPNIICIVFAGKPAGFIAGRVHMSLQMETESQESVAERIIREGEFVAVKLYTKSDWISIVMRSSIESLAPNYPGNSGDLPGDLHNIVSPHTWDLPRAYAGRYFWKKGWKSTTLGCPPMPGR